MKFSPRGANPDFEKLEDMNDRAHLFVSALVGSLLLRSLYGQSEINGFAMTGLVVILVSHVLDVALDSRGCRRLSRISILVTALAILGTTPFKLPDSTAGWVEYICLPLGVAALSLVPVYRRGLGSTDDELPAL